MTTLIKDVDSLGRIILPEKWIKGVKREIDLTKFFDSLEIEDIEELREKALATMLEEESSL